MMTAEQDIRALGNPQKGVLLQRFFKTGKGQYGEGDIFLGVTVPETRAVAKRYAHLSFPEIKKLLTSPFHECRLCALLILVEQFKCADATEQKNIIDLYLKHTSYVNNWDLVDLSAHKLLGEYLLDKDRSILLALARSDLLWERRIAIISTFAFLRKGQFDNALQLAEMLLHDKEDLMHKAVGWVLREVGKKDMATEETFLNKHAAQMPRTMLRYAIERFPEKKRKNYLTQGRKT